MPSATRHLSLTSSRRRRAVQRLSSTTRSSKSRRKHSTLKSQDARLLWRLSGLASRASLHGLNRLCSQEGWWPGQLAWAAVLLLATSGLCLHIWSEAIEYSLYPVSSSSKLALNSFEFPDVTICNPENPMKTRQFYLPDLGIANDKLQSRSGIWDDLDVRPIYRYEHYANISQFGTFPADLVVYCRYNQLPCSHENFTVVFDRSYGNCFTFVPRERRISRPDTISGLILILYDPAADGELERAQRVGKMGYKTRPREMAFDTEGYLVTLHARGTRPHPLENSHTVSLGQVATVALEQQNTQLADTPSNPCRKRESRRTYDSLLARTVNYTDTLNDCAQRQAIQALLKRCGCVPEGPVWLEDFPAKPNNPHSIRDRVPYCHLLVRDSDFNKTGVDNAAELQKFNEIVKPKVPSMRHKISLSNLSAQFPEIYRRYEAFRCYHREAKRRHLTEPDEAAAAATACPDVCQSESYTAAITSGLWPHLATPGSDDSFKQMMEVSRLLSDYLESNSDTNQRSLLGTSLRLRNLSLDFCHRNLTQWKLDHPPHRRSPDVQLALARCARLHEFVRRHFLLLKVYPRSLTVRLLQVERSFLPPQLLSRIGGSLGLWLGTSLISLFECGEVAATLLAYALYRCFNSFVKLLPSRRNACASAHASAPINKPNGSEMSTSNQVEVEAGEGDEDGELQQHVENCCRQNLFDLSHYPDLDAVGTFGPETHV